jgi:hypothetical protein
VENLLNLRRENHEYGPAGSHKLHYEKPGYRVFSKTNRDYNTFHLVAHRQQQHPQEVRYNKVEISQIISSLTALKPHIQSTPNLVNKYTYELPTY